MACYNSVVNNLITIVQGDSYTGNFTIKQNGEPVGTTVISNVWFTCSGLHIQKELTYDGTNHCFVLSFTDSETKLWRAGNFSFDLTLKFVTSNAIMTKIRNGQFTVLEKDNPVAPPNNSEV